MTEAALPAPVAAPAVDRERLTAIGFVLPSFVICLREGLEAALIVGIIAAFLGSQGRSDALRQVWLGVGAAVTLCLAVGMVVKYAVPGRRLKAAVPTSTLVVGGIGAVAGFFVIPLVGALMGFPLGIYVAERVRVGADGAWPSTRAALRAVGFSIMIELAAALVATAVWVGGVAAT